MVFKIIQDDYTVKKLVLVCLIVGLLFVNSTFVGNAVLCMSLFVMGMKGIDFDRMASMVLPWFIMGVLITVAGSQLGVIDNWSYFVGTSRPRVSLGYFYPSHATSALLYAVVLFCFVTKEKLSLWQVVLIEIVNIWQWRQTDSRTGSALIAIIPWGFLILKYIKKDVSRSAIGWVLKAIFPLCAMISLISCCFYGSFPFLVRVNSFVSGRISLGYDAIKTYGIHLFGQRIPWVGNGGLGHVVQQLQASYNFVDCSYVKILLDNGLIIWLIVMCIFTATSIYAVNCNKKYLALALFFIAGYSVIEPRLIELGFNPFILATAVVLDNRQMDTKNTTGRIEVTGVE